MAAKFQMYVIWTTSYMGKWMQNFCTYMPKHNQLKLKFHILLSNMCCKQTWPTIWEYMLYMPTLDMPIWGYMNIYMPHMKSLSTYLTYITKYGCHILKIAHTANILNGYTDFFCKCTHTTNCNFFFNCY